MAFTLGFGETNGCLDLSLQDQVLTMVTHVELEFTINHYAREGGGEWDWQRIRSLLTTQVCDKIAAIRPPSPRSSDFPCWNLSNDGSLTLKTAYQVLYDKSEPSPPSVNLLFSVVWNW